VASLAGKHVVVLGGTSGFGFGVARAALDEGARVTIGSRSEERVREACRRLGNAVRGEAVDITDRPGLDKFFARLGGFDHLAVTAGDALLSKKLLEMSEEEARGAFEVRFWGQFHAVRAAYPQISRSGSITLVSGGLSRRPGPGRAIYTAALAGLEGLVKGFAAELAPVRVNAVTAGTVDTELWHRMPEAERLAHFERAAARLPVGRVGRPEDIAEAYLYLMKNGFSTGQSIVVDGGALQVV
jgi:NAD(P)-dependent dehydrogenase (short-subunit alcohol dehydrogenase family)